VISLFNWSIRVFISWAWEATERAHMARERKWETCVAREAREDRAEASGGGGIEGTSRFDELALAELVRLDNNSRSNANISV